jgi:hypothetical protein
MEKTGYNSENRYLKDSCKVEFQKSINAKRICRNNWFDKRRCDKYFSLIIKE